MDTLCVKIATHLLKCVQLATVLLVGRGIMRWSKLLKLLSFRVHSLKTDAVSPLRVVSINCISLLAILGKYLCNLNCFELQMKTFILLVSGKNYKSLASNIADSIYVTNQKFCKKVDSFLIEQCKFSLILVNWTLDLILRNQLLHNYLGTISTFWLHSSAWFEVILYYISIPESFSAF
jgi:hypothetical protein